MKKKIYAKPSMKVVELQQRQQLLAGSSLTERTNSDDYEEMENGYFD